MGVVAASAACWDALAEKPGRSYMPVFAKATRFFALRRLDWVRFRLSSILPLDPGAGGLCSLAVGDGVAAVSVKSRA